MWVTSTFDAPGWRVKRYQGSAAMATAGIPVTTTAAATTDIGEVVAAAASGAAQAPLVGITIDTAADPAATGLTSASDIEVKVVVNPQALIAIRMSGSSTVGTDLTIHSTTGASAGGTVTTGVSTLDDGIIWGYDGGNPGVVRRADDTAGSVSMNFPNAIASGDRFLIAPVTPASAGLASANKFFDLTTDLTELDSSATSTDNDNFIVVQVQARDEANEGEKHSYYLCVANDHVFAGNAQRS